MKKILVCGEVVGPEGSLRDVFFFFFFFFFFFLFGVGRVGENKRPKKDKKTGIK